MNRPLTRDFDLLFEGVDLRAYTKDVNGQQVKFIGGTASSTAEDLYEGVIVPSAQRKMRDKLVAFAAKLADKNSGMTAWLNHSYEIPEDTLGAFTSAKVTTRKGDGVTSDTETEYLDLDIECRVTDTNPRAIQAWEQVRDGINHGWSIGAIFTDVEYKSNDPESPDFWKFLVNDLNLLEISLVGLPANQRAWCRNAEDLDAKAHALRQAEQIACDARNATDAVRGRELVTRSLVHLGEPSAMTAITVKTEWTTESLLALPCDTLDAARTSLRTVQENLGALTDDGLPEHYEAFATFALRVRELAAEAGEDVTEAADPKKPYGNVAYADPGYQKDGVHRYPLDTVEHIKAAASYFGKQSNRDKYTQSQQKKIEARIEAAERQHGIGKEDADHLLHTENDQHATFNVNVQTRSADGCATVRLGLNEVESTDIGTQLRERNAGGQDALLTQAADALDALASLVVVTSGIETRDNPEDSDPTGSTPDDIRDQLSMAMGHIAKAVGHGLCVRSAGHIAKALDCMSAVIGNVVEQPGPQGDDVDEPGSQMSGDEIIDAIYKLEAKDGDTIILHAANAEAVTALTEQLTTEFSALRFIVVTGDTTLSIDGQLAAKAAELAKTDHLVVLARGELQTAKDEAEQTLAAVAAAKDALAEATAKLDELQAAIDEAAQRRLGKPPAPGATTTDETRGSDVRPEFYKKNSTEQRQALAQSVAQPKVTSARDTLLPPTSS